MEERKGNSPGRGTGGGQMTDVQEMVRGIQEEAREVIGRAWEQLDMDRRIREQPLATLGIAAAAGFVLGGGLWPVLRPFVRAAARTAMSPTNLLAMGAAIGAMRAAGYGAEERDVGESGMPEPS